MPYRRLPNTDAARIRAMRVALEKGKALPPNKMAYSSKTIIRLQKFLPAFEIAIQTHRQTILSQNKKSKDYIEIVRKSRLYLTHFLRVMNMAILRGDLPVETRAFYGLPTNDSSVPPLNTDNELTSWGKRIIEGEELRIRKGGSPITNPTIAVVKVRYAHFLEAMNFFRVMVKKSLDNSEKTNEIRKEVDDIILQLWNEIETTFKDSPEEKRKSECENYGVVYFYRKTELGKAESVEA
jgi:hypothetical protein